MKKIIIIGSSSFIGKNFVKKYSDKYSIDLLSKKNGYFLNKKIQYKTNKKVDYIIHLASHINEYKNEKNKYLLENYLGTYHCLNLCYKLKAKLIFPSTYVYGKPDYLPIDENHIIKPHNLYAHSKIMSENLCKTFHSIYGVPITILRLFNIFGKKQKKGFLINDLIENIKLKKNNQSNFINYRTKRDYLFIDDLIDLMDKIISKDYNKFDIFNVGSGKFYNIQEIAKVISKYSNKSNFKIIKSNKTHPIKNCLADIRKVSNEFNWKPKHDLHSAIKIILNEKE